MEMLAMKVKKQDDKKGGGEKMALWNSCELT